MNKLPAHRERDLLSDYISTNIALATHVEVRKEASEGVFDLDYIHWTIGHAAAFLAEMTDIGNVIHFTENTMRVAGFTSEEKKETWQSIVEHNVYAAAPKLRDALGLIVDQSGATTLPENFDLTDPRNYFALVKLYEAGDISLLPYLHQYFDLLDGDRLSFGVRHAVKLYEAGDDSAFDIIEQTAQRARDYAYQRGDLDEQTEKEKGLSADDASDLRAGITAVISTLREMSGTQGVLAAEKHYGQANIALRYFAKDLLERGEDDKADRIQALVISSFANAWLNAWRVKLNKDLDGTRLQAVLDYLGIYGESVGANELELIDLIYKHVPEFADEYELAFDPNIPKDSFDKQAVADALVTMHNNGDVRAHDKLIELLGDDEEYVSTLINSLVNMGYTDEAIKLTRQRFEKDPNYSKALTLMNIAGYDEEALRVVQSSAAEYHTSMIKLIHDRTRHLGFLVSRICELEGRKQSIKTW